MYAIDRHNNGISTIIIENIKKYNKDNNSISYDDLKAILLSIEYVLTNYGNDQKDMIANYHQAINKLTADYESIHKRYLKLLNNLFITDNTFYNDTIKYGLKGFFKSYNYIYNASDKIITADYPTYLTINEEGILYVKKYINYLTIENTFLQSFDHQKIHHLLLTYDVDYHNIPINIFTYVLLHALGCKICHKELYTLNINDIEYLKQTLNSETKINKTLDKYLFVLKRAYKLKDNLYRYIKKGQKQLINMIMYHDLNKVFLIIKEHKILNLYPSQLTNEQFDHIVSIIDDDNYLNVLNSLASIYDIIDIMDECLNQKQIINYLNTLDENSQKLINKYRNGD